MPGDAYADRWAEVLEHLETGTDHRAERYRQLPAAVDGRPAEPSHAEEFAWPAEALRAHG